MPRPLAAACLALVAALLVAVAPGDARRPRAMLPDLDQVAVGCPGAWKGSPLRCTDWDVCMVRDAAAPNGPCVKSGPIAAVRLRFTSSVDNVGDGPLLVYARRSGRAQRHMRVRQAFADAAGSVPQRFAAAARSLPDARRDYLYYEPSRSHRHWHLENFEHFSLRATDGRGLVADRKNGVCLGDRYEAARAGTLRHRPRTGQLDALHHEMAFNTGTKPSAYNCQLGRSDTSPILGLREGISVGQGDDYAYVVDYQWLDITRVPSGTYLVVNEVNRDRALKESSYANNASSIRISIQWPDGAVEPPGTITRAPEVTLRNSCPDSARCDEPAAAAGRRGRVATTRSFVCPLTRSARR